MINEITIDGVISDIRRRGKFFSVILANIGKAKTEYFEILTTDRVEQTDRGKYIKVLGHLGTEAILWRNEKGLRTVIYAENIL